MSSSTVLNTVLNTDPGTDPTTAPRRRPVVYLLHGLLGTAYAHFGPQISVWESECSVVPIDLPGHGRCPLDAGEPYFDGALEYTLAIIERFGGGRLVAASHLGGPLAVRVASVRPDLVSCLVLTGFVPQLDRTAFLGLLAGFGTLAAQNPTLAAEYERLHGARWRDTLAAVARNAERDFEGTVHVTSRALARLAPATLICNGSLKSAERSAALEAGTHGPRVSGRVLDGAGHIAGLQDPAAFAAAVADFWRVSDRSNV
jgi:pimeloyl-ACP methyl ester carboxylesterase